MNQQSIPFIAPAKTPILVDESLLRMCRHRLDAIRLCVQLSNYTHETIAQNLGIDKGHFSRIMQGKAWFPDSKSIDLMTMCGNYAPMQYEAMVTGFQLFKDTKAQRKAELLAELATLEERKEAA